MHNYNYDWMQNIMILTFLIVMQPVFKFIQATYIVNMKKGFTEFAYLHD